MSQGLEIEKRSRPAARSSITGAFVRLVIPGLRTDITKWILISLRTLNLVLKYYGAIALKTLTASMLVETVLPDTVVMGVWVFVRGSFLVWISRRNLMRDSMLA